VATSLAEQKAPLLTRFGRYVLLDRLGKGGMGEVYLAKLAGPMGVTRYVALKRVLEGMTSDKVAQMFVDEMRLAVRLTHPNIVAVYDFGLEGDSYYLAMEFIEGTDIHQLLKRAHARKQANVEAALYMLAQVARGLDYAHKLADGQGRPLEIVHRDVTPANIMISYNGDVKLADFGIARAAAQVRMTHTEAGEIKGKIRYMSPEQARAEKIDGRSDLFSLGTVLLELLTLKPAFAGESDIDSLMQVQSGVPKDWEACKAKIPEDVIPVLQKAMAKDRDERYANGAELAEGCELVLRKRDPGYGSAKLAAYIEALFVKEHTQLRERMHRYEGAAAPEVTSSGTSSGGGTGSGGHSLTPVSDPSRMQQPGTQSQFVNKPTSNTTTDASPQSEVLAVGTMGGTRGSVIAQVQPQKVSKGVMYGVLAGVLVAGGMGAAVLKNHPGAGGLGAAAMPVPTAVAPVGTPAQLPNAVAPPPTPSVKTGRLLLTTNTAGTKVFLDKSPLEKSTSPVAAGGTSFRVDVPAGTDWVLRVEADGFTSVTLPLKLLPGEETSLPVVLPPVGTVSAQKPVLILNTGGGPRRPSGGGGGGERPHAAGNDDMINPF
jgi:serine/threonine protein kinase